MDPNNRKNVASYFLNSDRSAWSSLRAARLNKQGDIGHELIWMCHVLDHRKTERSRSPRLVQERYQPYN
jgi:hypothetical protein